MTKFELKVVETQIEVLRAFSTFLQGHQTIPNGASQATQIAEGFTI